MFQVRWLEQRDSLVSQRFSQRNTLLRCAFFYKKSFHLKETIILKCTHSLQILPNIETTVYVNGYTHRVHIRLTTVNGPNFLQAL